MADRHNPSSIRKDRLTLMAESREVNEDRRQSPIIKNHKGSSMHLHQHQHTKDADKRVGEHKCKHEHLSAQQSRRQPEQPDVSQPIEMPPRMKKPMTPKPSPRKIIWKPRDLKDQSLKGRLTRILSAKIEECNWALQKKLLWEWGISEKNVWKEQATPIVKSGITRYLSAPQIAKMGDLKDLAAKYIVS